MSSAVSPLGPIDPASVPEAETEKSAPWIVRKLVGVRQPSHLTARAASPHADCDVLRAPVAHDVVDDRPHCAVLMGDPEGVWHQRRLFVTGTSVYMAGCGTISLIRARAMRSLLLHSGVTRLPSFFRAFGSGTLRCTLS